MASQSRAGQPALHGLEFGINEWLVDEQYERYLHDPGSVDRTWRELFASPIPAPRRETRNGATTAQESADDADDAAVKAVRVAALIEAYRVRGHLVADTDPLTAARAAAHPELELTAFGLREDDLQREFVVDGFSRQATMTLRDVLKALQESYCRTVGTEYMHIQSSQERRWIQQRIESPQPPPDVAEQLQILYRLGAAEAFETFLQ
ncbi:hypothetical protein ACFVRU_51155, partial [Streptomyces sp. NPDC057927]